MKNVRDLENESRSSTFTAVHQLGMLILSVLKIWRAGVVFRSRNKFACHHRLQFRSIINASCIRHEYLRNAF
jgi:hypothetical protein